MRKVVILICMLAATSALAQTTGKIVGKVIDKETGEPLPYVNVIVDQTTMGAATSLDGTYFIINVPVGQYTVKASIIGYKITKMENVKVSAGLTTVVDFQLEPTVLELEEIVVTAKRPIVQKDVTSTVRLIEGETIDRMPVREFQDVVALQAGAIETGRSLSGGLHVRGGRGNEVVYIVDGINVNDPVRNLPGIILAASAIEELQFLSGGFNAEFGEAMSGVVNIVTREGGAKYGGRIRYTTDRSWEPLGNMERYSYPFDNVDFSLGGPLPLIPNKKARFFVSGEITEDEGRLPNSDQHTKGGTAKLTYKPIPRISLALSGNWSRQKYHRYYHANSKGDWLRETPLFERGNSQVSLKLTHTLNPTLFYELTLGRFNTNLKLSAQDGKHYNDFKAIGERLPWVGVASDEDWWDPEWRTWKDSLMRTDPSLQKYFEAGFGPEEVAWMHYYESRGYGEWDEEAGRWRWSGRNPSQKLKNAYEALNNRYYEVNSWQYVIDEDGDTLDIYYHMFDLDKYVEDVRKYIADPSAFPEDSIEPSGNMYLVRYNQDQPFRDFDYYFRPMWHRRNTTHYTFNFALTKQIPEHHEIKAGTFFRKHFLSLSDVQFVNANPYMDDYEKEPTAAAAYLQDKIEYEEMTMNAGLRFDYFDPQSKFFVQYDSLEAGKEDVGAKWQISPRFGVSFAISEKAVMYASYGHFFQPIDLGDLYQNLEADVTSGLPLIGNPDLPPKKTIAYETGLRYAFSPDLAAEVTAYYKDVKTLLGTRQVNTILWNKLVSYTIFKLEDFAVIKGVDFVLQKRASEFLSGSLTYSYTDAKGTGSSEREFYYVYMLSGVDLPKSEFPLEFDVTHAIKADLNFYLPSGFGPTILNFKPLSNLNINTQFTFASGPPYTPVSLKGQPLAQGSKRLPANHWTDVKIGKTFNLNRHLRYGLFLEISNLFDHKNVVDVYATTGEWDDNGDPPDWEPSQYQNYEDYGYSSAWEYHQADLANWERRVSDPTNLSRPRRIRLGVFTEF